MDPTVLLCRSTFWVHCVCGVDLDPADTGTPGRCLRCIGARRFVKRCLANILVRPVAVSALSTKALRSPSVPSGPDLSLSSPWIPRSPSSSSSDSPGSPRYGMSRYAVDPRPGVISPPHSPSITVLLIHQLPLIIYHGPIPTPVR